jgi:glycerol uptake operon antiterminator
MNAASRDPLSPIVVAVREPKDLAKALRSPHRTVFLLTSSLSSVGLAVETVKRSGKQIFVHMDLVEGLAKDAAGLQWLAETVRPTGIITTRAPMVGKARHLGLLTVQRIFLVDSQSVQTGVHLAREVKPDYLEVMPGVVPEVIRSVVKEAPCPVIAGGLCQEVDHYLAARAAGAVAISTSAHKLWEYRTTGGGEPDAARHMGSSRQST